MPLAAATRCVHHAKFDMHDARDRWFGLCGVAVLRRWLFIAPLIAACIPPEATPDASKAKRAHPNALARKQSRVALHSRSSFARVRYGAMRCGAVRCDIAVTSFVCAPTDGQVLHRRSKLHLDEAGIRVRCRARRGRFVEGPTSAYRTSAPSHACASHQLLAGTAAARRPSMLLSCGGLSAGSLCCPLPCPRWMLRSLMRARAHPTHAASGRLGFAGEGW